MKLSSPSYVSYRSAALMIGPPDSLGMPVAVVIHLRYNKGLTFLLRVE